MILGSSSIHFAIYPNTWHNSHTNTPHTRHKLKLKSCTMPDWLTPCMGTRCSFDYVQIFSRHSLAGKQTVDPRVLRSKSTHMPTFSDEVQAWRENCGGVGERVSLLHYPRCCCCLCLLHSLAGDVCCGTCWGNEMLTWKVSAYILVALLLTGENKLVKMLGNCIVVAYVWIFDLQSFPFKNYYLSDAFCYVMLV